MFGSFLVARGLLEPDQVREALARQRAGRPALGELAVKRGIMGARDVERVLARQADRRTLRFGDLAVRMGLLKQDQLLDLLMEQQDLQQPLGEILVQMGAISARELEAELEAYHRASVPERLAQVRAWRAKHGHASVPPA